MRFQPKQIPWNRQPSIPPGTLYGKLRVLRATTKITASSVLIASECRCTCGNLHVVANSVLRAGETRSCGCSSLDRRTRYGLSHDPVYRSWRSMQHRCYVETNDDYHRYGGRGIVVCDRWRESFAAFVEDMGLRPSSLHTLDRKNNDGNYTPENCRWATKKEQAVNRASTIYLEHNGVRATFSEWSDRLGISRGTIRSRYYAGKSIEQILSTSTIAGER